MRMPSDENGCRVSSARTSSSERLRMKVNSGDGIAVAKDGRPVQPGLRLASSLGPAFHTNDWPMVSPTLDELVDIEISLSRPFCLVITLAGEPIGSSPKNDRGIEDESFTNPSTISIDQQGALAHVMKKRLSTSQNAPPALLGARAGARSSTDAALLMSDADQRSPREHRS